MWAVREGFLTEVRLGGRTWPPPPCCRAGALSTDTSRAAVASPPPGTHRHTARPRSPLFRVCVSLGHRGPFVSWKIRGEEEADPSAGPCPALSPPPLWSCRSLYLNRHHGLPASPRGQDGERRRGLLLGEQPRPQGAPPAAGPGDHRHQQGGLSLGQRAGSSPLLPRARGPSPFFCQQSQVPYTLDPAAQLSWPWGPDLQLRELDLEQLQLGTPQTTRCSGAVTARRVAFVRLPRAVRPASGEGQDSVAEF